MTTRTMGPIEKELRGRVIEREDLVGLGFATSSMLHGAARSLGVSMWSPELWPDVFSEAIEAAEALGL